MSKKSLIIFMAVAIVAIVVIHIFRSHHAAVPAKPVAPLVPPAAKKTAPPAAPVTSHDQSLIDSYTAQISAGKTDNGNAYYQRGLLYLKLQQNRSAIEDFTDALKSVPNAPGVLYARALAYRQEQMLDNAVTDLTSAIRAKSNFIDAYNARGLIYVDKNDFVDALADYKSALALDAKASDVYFNLGTLYTRQKQYDDAIKAFTQAITTNVPPSNATPDDLAVAKKRLMQAYLNRASAEMENGDYKTALTDATYVVTNDPQNMQAFLLRSQIYDKLGNSAAAATDSAAADSLSMQQMLDNSH